MAEQIPDVDSTDQKTEEQNKLADQKLEVMLAYYLYTNVLRTKNIILKLL